MIFSQVFNNVKTIHEQTFSSRPGVEGIMEANQTRRFALTRIVGVSCKLVSIAGRINGRSCEIKENE